MGFKKLILLLVAALLLAGCASDEEKKARYLSQADEAMQKGEYKVAEIHLKNALQLDPQSVEAHLKLGEVSLKSDNPQGAFSAYAAVVRIDPENTEALLKLATFYMLGRNFVEAEKHVALVLGNTPNNIEALFLSAGLNEMQGRRQEAARDFTRIIALDGRQVRAYIGMAGISAGQGRLEEAEDYLHKARAAGPDDTKALLALVSLYAAQKAYDRAEAELSKGIASHPENAELRLTQGNLYAQQKKNEDAEKAYLKAIDLDPQSVGSYVTAARFYEAIGHSAQAQSMYRQVAALNPTDGAGLVLAARYFFNSREIDEASGYVEKALAARPNFSPALMIKGEILVAQRKWNDAIAVFDQVIGQDAHAGQAYYFKALSLLGKGDVQIAKAVLNKSIELNPKDLRAKSLRADIFLKERDFANAEKGSREVLGALPDNYQALTILCRSLTGQSRLLEARPVIDRMIALQPENATGYIQKGIVQWIEKENAAARESFEKALSLDQNQLEVLARIVTIDVSENDFPAALARCDRQLEISRQSSFHKAFIMNLKGRLFAAQNMDAEAESAFQAAIATYANLTQPYYGLAQLYLKHRDIDKAVAQYDAMLQKNPDMAGPHMLLGTLYDAQKRFDLSEKHYREVLRIDADFAPAANNLAFLLAGKPDQLDEALRLAQRAKEKMPQDPSVMDTLGWIYYKKGLYDSAVAEFTESIERLPNNAGVHYHLGMTYYKQGKGELAKEHLARALQLEKEFDGVEDARKTLSEL